MSKVVTIIDYQVGNLFSVVNAFKHLGVTVNVSNDKREIEEADYLVLPGVGAFPDGMKALTSENLPESIGKYCSKGRPFLGICLGMQMMLSMGEEFERLAGLDIISGKVTKIPTTVDGVKDRLKVPHIGWSPIHANDDQSWDGSILSKTKLHTPFYFVHSYYAVTTDQSETVAYVNYGGHKLAAVIQKNNIIGCQFHPERSGPEGLRLLDNFLRS